MLCYGCGDSLIDLNKRVYISEESLRNGDVESGDALYWCKKCKDSTEHEHKRVRFKGIPGLTQDDPAKAKDDDGEDDGTK